MVEVQMRRKLSGWKAQCDAYLRLLCRQTQKKINFKVVSIVFRCFTYRQDVVSFSENVGKRIGKAYPGLCWCCSRRLCTICITWQSNSVDVVQAKLTFWLQHWGWRWIFVQSFVLVSINDDQFLFKTWPQHYHCEPLQARLFVLEAPQKRDIHVQYIARLYFLAPSELK